MFVHSVFGPVPEDLKEVIPADALHSRYLSVIQEVITIY
jgi:hypothetical protein